MQTQLSRRYACSSSIVHLCPTLIRDECMSMRRLNTSRIAFLGYLILAALRPACADAGSIYGVVKSEGKPIIGATVRLLELNRALRTDARGEFIFEGVPNGSYQVFVRVVGFASATNNVSVADDRAGTTFLLRESAIEAEEIVVSASPFARRADDQYQSVEAKSAVEFREGAGSSFAEKISDLPGVTVRSNGSAPTRPVLRGLSDNRVLILENGLRTGDLSTYDPAHAVPIEASSIAEIEVVRGPSSVLFGPSTIGGLVNVVTNTIPTASTNPFSGSVSVSGNSVSDEYSGFMNAVYSMGGHALGVSAGGLHSRDIRIPSGRYIDPESGEGFDLNRMPQSFNHVSEASAGYSYQSDFGMIGIAGKHYEMNYGIPGVPPNPDWEEVPPATSRIAQKKNSLELQSLVAIDDAVLKQVRLNANYVEYNHSEYPTAQDSSGVSDPQANHFTKRAFNATAQMRHEYSRDFGGTIGLWTNIEDLAIDGEMPLGPNSLTTGFAGYIFEEFHPSDDARIQLGLRYDYSRIHTSPNPASTASVFRALDIARLSNAVTASVGGILKVSPELTLSLNVARSFRAPTVQELFADGLDAASGTYSKGDAELTPETGVGVDASVKGAFETVSFEISPYLNFITDYIYAFLTGDTLESFPVRQFSATDARLMGFEASIMAQVARNVGIRASVDYVNAQDTRNSVPLPFTPPLRGLLRITYHSDTYSGMVEWRLAAPQNRLGDGDSPTPGYGVVNIGAGIRLVQWGLVHSVSVHCDNLFNHVYRDHLSVIKDFLPQPARGVRLNYDLLF